MLQPFRNPPHTPNPHLTLLHYPTDPMTQRYLEVVLPVPLRSAFTYAVPTSFNGEELVGRRVLVPFRNRAMVGVGLAVSNQAPEDKTHQRNRRTARPRSQRSRPD